MPEDQRSNRKLHVSGRWAEGRCGNMIKIRSEIRSASNLCSRMTALKILTTQSPSPGSITQNLTKSGSVTFGALGAEIVEIGEVGARKAGEAGVVLYRPPVFWQRDFERSTFFEIFKGSVKVRIKS